MGIPLGILVGLWGLLPLPIIFQLYRCGIFFSGGNRSTWRKPQS